MSKSYTEFTLRKLRNVKYEFTAVFVESNAKLITSKDFIAKHKLGTPSSAHSAVSALLSKEMIYKEGDDYFVYDVFLERWLECFAV